MAPHGDAPGRCSERSAAAPQSAGAARRWVRSCLDGRADVDVDAAELLVSELATNAVVHGGAPFVLWVEASPGAVRIGVEDPGRGLPVVRRGDDTSHSGRGLAIVDAVAHRWGVDRAATGKCTWFELRTLELQAG